MRTIKLFAFIGLFLLVSVFGCTAVVDAQSSKSVAMTSCVTLCNDALMAGIDLSGELCLSDNNPDWKVKGWVCYVSENNCKEFIDGNVSHFVEVSERCDLIQAV
ncbi:MAG TPA: hypothetical protein ENN30_01505 [Candidatus Woesearchaeota archaeon]|nr:hypothetical protein [Candidatus Woesearchaeota archaeon]